MPCSTEDARAGCGMLQKGFPWKRTRCRTAPQEAANRQRPYMTHDEARAIAPASRKTLCGAL
eukprot:scaffold13971_cov69-Phaeocystis_antarctica.AAC.15